jgi:hypothetical protein
VSEVSGRRERSDRRDTSGIGRPVALARSVDVRRNAAQFSPTLKIADER